MLQESARLTTSAGVLPDFFTIPSVAVSGDTIVAGASNVEIGDADNQGMAFVFVRPPGGWNGDLTETATLSASDGAEDDRFGASIAVSGDTVVVTASGDFIREDEEGEQIFGSAYVFVRPPTSWAGALTENAKLTGLEQLGPFPFLDTSSVAISGDTVVGSRFGGEALVFVKPAGGWAGDLTKNATLTVSDNIIDFSGGVGSSLAVSGSTVVAGQYVFVRPAEGWAGTLTENARLRASDEEGNGFGSRVAVSGDTFVVGAPFDEIGPADAQGSAYVFEDVDAVVADLQISMADSPDPVPEGANLTYAINVTNNGPSNATGVIVKDGDNRREPVIRRYVEQRCERQEQRIRFEYREQPGYGDDHGAGSR